MRKFLFTLLLCLSVKAKAQEQVIVPQLGQQTMANSASVAIASNQSAIPVSQSGSWTNACTQSGAWILGANSGVDIGDVTINNGSGASAVNIQDGGNSITIDGTVTCNLGTIAGVATSANQSTEITHLSNIATSESVIDDWDESDRAKVNIIVGQAGIAAGTGIDGATVPRVSLATNVPLPAGTNAIGKLSANSGVDIGDVDVTSSALPSGASTSANQSTEITALGSLTETAPASDTASSGLNGRLQRIAQRITTLIGSTLSVTGTVTSANSTSSTMTEATCGVTTSSASCLASSGSRKSGYLQNNSDTDIWCSLGGTATAAPPTTKIMVGGVLNLTTGGVIYTGAVNCIHASTGTKNATVASN